MASTFSYIKKKNCLKKNTAPLANKHTHKGEVFSEAAA